MLMNHNSLAAKSWIWKLDEEIDFEYLKTFTGNTIQLVTQEELPTALDIQLKRAKIMGEQVFFEDDNAIHTRHPMGHDEFVADSYRELVELIESQELFVMQGEGLITLYTAQVIVTNQSISIIDKLLQPMEKKKFHWLDEINDDLPAMIKIIEGHDWIYGLAPNGAQTSSWETRHTPHNFEAIQQLD